MSPLVDSTAAHHASATHGREAVGARPARNDAATPADEPDAPVADGVRGGIGSWESPCACPGFCHRDHQLD